MGDALTRLPVLQATSKPDNQLTSIDMGIYVLYTTYLPTGREFVGCADSWITDGDMSFKVTLPA